MKRFLLFTTIVFTAIFTFGKVPTNGLVAYYPFNGNANDAVGANHGTVNGATLTTNRFGQTGSAYSFDGIDDWINAGTNLNFNTSFTISLHCSTNNFGNNPSLFSQGQPVTNGGLHIALINQSVYRFAFYGNDIETGSGFPPLNTWGHYVFSYNHQTQSRRIYLNGVLLANGNSVPYTGTGITAIGKNIVQDAANGRYNGKLDDLRIYNRALTDSEVQALHQAEAPPIDLNNGLVAYYPFNGNANDASGNSNHGTAQNGVTFGVDRFGNAGKAASFDGVDDFIETNMQKNNLSGYTISTWVKTIDNDFAIVENRGPVNQGGKSITLRYWEGKWAIVIDGDFIFIGKYIPYSNQNNWMNITTTWDKQNNTSYSPSQFKIYINGVIVNSSDYSTGAANIPHNPNGNLKIGSHAAFSNFFKGDLDDLRIYNRALSDAEILTLYNSENSGIALSTAMRFSGGQTILTVGTAHNFTANLKNNSSSPWVGDVYLKVKGVAPTLISSTNFISAGGTYNISSTFTPQTSQIGSGVTMELLTKQGTNDFVRVATVNGTVNPVVVGIESITSITKSPLIAIDKPILNIGEAFTLTGSNFSANAILVLDTEPEIIGFTLPILATLVDGSFATNITLPSTFKGSLLTVKAQDQNGFTAKTYLSLNNNSNEQLKILEPIIANKNYVITKNGKFQVQFSDYINRVANSTSSTRNVQYEIGFMYSGGTAYFPLKTLLPKMYGLSAIQKWTEELDMSTHFTTISSEEGWPIKFVVKDLNNPLSIAESPIINLRIVEKLTKIVTKFDKSYPVQKLSEPRGVCADGTARIFFVVEKETNNPNIIQSVSMILQSKETDQNPNFDNDWLGTASYLPTQSDAYNETFSGLLGGISSSQTADGKYWFYYVAPKDFTRENLPQGFNEYDLANERYVNAKFTITYTNNTVEVIDKWLTIVRPPLYLIHGLNGNEQAWKKSQFALNPYYANLFKKIEFAQMSPNESFSWNASYILGQVDWKTGLEFGASHTSMPAVIERMRNEGWSCNRVDYVSHSMGGNVLRTAEAQVGYYVGQNSSSKYKNYSKGYVNKFISLATPHEGSPVADLLGDAIQFLPPKALYIASGLVNFSYFNNNKDDTWWSNVVRVNPNSSYSGWKGKLLDALKAFTIVPYAFETTPAVKNLEVMAGGDGIRFGETKIKSHAIVCDMFPGTGSILNMENIIVNNPKYYNFFKILTDIIDFSTFEENTSGIDSPLYDFVSFVKQTNPEEFTEIMGMKKNPISDVENSDALEMVENVKKGLLIFKQLGLWLGTYSDFSWNSDWVVPIKSQASGNLLAPNVTILNNQIFQGFGLFHVFSTDNLEVSQKIKDLLNMSISSTYFGFLQPNSQLLKRRNSVNSLASKPTESNATNQISDPKHLIDKSKIKIISPNSETIAEVNTILNLKVEILDTLKLKEFGIVFQGNTLSRGVRISPDQIYNFSVPINEKWSEKILLFAFAKYVVNNVSTFRYDTLSVITKFSGNLNNFKVAPKFVNLEIGQNIIPNFILEYPNHISDYIDSTKLNVNLSNTNSIDLGKSLKIFAKNKGESMVIFTYDSIFKDTMFVAVGGGGLPYSQIITTNSLINANVCAGQILQVPFTTSGGSFEIDNQFLVQISNKNGENFKTIATGSVSPISTKLPNDIDAGVGYKIRVVSTDVPVTGSNSPTTLTITAFGTPPTISANKSTFWNGESVVLTASSCPIGQSIKWSDGLTSNPITITPSESVTYTVVCTDGTCETANSAPVFISKNFCPVDYARNVNVSSGENIFKASNSIQANNKISGTGTKETLEAKSIILNPGFEANQGVIFKVHIGGCTN